MARTLILLDMLFSHGTKISVPGHKPTLDDEDAPLIIAYLYSCQIIPAAAREKLLLHIQRLILLLESEADTGPFVLVYMSPTSRGRVLHCLKRWQEPMEKKSQYRVKTVRRVLVDGSGNPMMGGFMGHSGSEFGELGVVFPGRYFAARRDPALVNLMQRYRLGSHSPVARAARMELGDHIDAKWAVNPTIFDLDVVEMNSDGINRWLAALQAGQTEERRSLEKDKMPGIEWDPTELLPKLARGPKSGASEGRLINLSQIFGKVSTWSGRLVVEGVLGEMADFMERMRWNCLHLSERMAISDGVHPIDSSTFPRVYDRMYMSNIPDYVGGFLTTAMYVCPVLRAPEPERLSTLRFNILLNPMEWRNNDKYLSEYTLMYGEKPISSHFSLTRAGPSSPFPIPGDYIVWCSTLATRPLDGKDKLTKPQLEKWLYTHFLKLCLPFPRPKNSMSPVQAPLNLTAFLRLLSHASELGYPGHWLAAIVSSICSGIITTAARAPIHFTTDPQDIDIIYPAQQMSVAPWVAGFTTILSMWARILLFGLIGLPPSDLVWPADIAMYNVTFPPFLESDDVRPHFELVFWDFANSENMGNVIPKGPISRLPSVDGRVRKVLLYDEKGDTSVSCKNFRNGGGVHLISALTYAAKTRTASFWCKKSLVRDLMVDGSDWRVFLWRTDTWSRVSEGVRIKGGLKQVRD